MSGSGKATASGRRCEETAILREVCTTDVRSARRHRGGGARGLRRRTAALRETDGLRLGSRPRRDPPGVGAVQREARTLEGRREMASEGGTGISRLERRGNGPRRAAVPRPRGIPECRAESPRRRVPPGSRERIRRGPEGELLRRRGRADPRRPLRGRVLPNAGGSPDRREIFLRYRGGDE